MPVAVTARQANESRQGNTFPEVIEKPFYRSLYFGSPPARGGKVQEDKKVLPQAYLIEQPEDVDRALLRLFTVLDDALEDIRNSLQRAKNALRSLSDQ